MSADSSAVLTIGVAGPSGSGKSTLAQGIAAAFAAWEPAIISLDSFYRGIDNPWFPPGEEPNFDTPEALDWVLATEQIRALCAGREADVPRYDFATHLRLPEPQRLRAGRMIVVEGILALHHEPLNTLLSQRIYVHAPTEICRDRRVERDVVERGRSLESVLEQWRSTVEPMLTRYVAPQRERAQFVASGILPKPEMTAAAVRWLREQDP